MADKHKVTFVQKLLLALLIVVSMSSCERKPLYLQSTSQVAVEAAVYKIELEFLWGTHWQTEWQYDWDEVAYGPLGYTEPRGVRAVIYGLNKDMVRDNYFTQNFSSSGERVTLLGGNWYDMLFYNNGTNYILFDTDDNHQYYHATTRKSMRPNKKPSVATREYTDMNQPDELFGTFMEKNEVSLNPEDYDLEYDEDGNPVYVYTLNAYLYPHTMIYLVQVMLINNTNDQGEKIVKGAKNLFLTGLASGVDLFTRVNSNDCISITTDDIKPLQTDRTLRLPDGSTRQGDIMATRMLTWGLPGIDPLAGQRRSETAMSDSCYVGIGLTMSNDAEYHISGNITEQLGKRPSGGVITIVIDAATLPEPPKPGEGSGGGFDAEVDDWDNNINADIII